jgi:lysophospholipase L1-like esterase
MEGMHGSRWRRRASAAVLVLGSAGVGLVAALALTPPVAVAVFGQELRLGAVGPSGIRGVSGPGQAELFGQGPVQTALVFDGPIRPRLVWPRFDRTPAAAEFVETSPETGPQLRTSALGGALAAGWTSYLLRLALVAGAASGVVCVGLLGAHSLVRPSSTSGRTRGAVVRRVSAAIAAGGVLTAASAAATVASARAQLTSVATLSQITGRAPLVPSPAPVGPSRPDVELAVIGDSTAAGVGNDPVVPPSLYDDTCGRSRDAYAVVLGSALRTSVANLACSSATIDSGLLGRQVEGEVRIPPQVGVLKSLPSLRAVVVSIGANDIGWADFLRLCYGLERCDDLVSERLFQSRLESFRIGYAQLLQQLSSLPTRPTVVVVGYYDPFGESFDCEALRDRNGPAVPPPGYGFAAEPGGGNQEDKIRQKLDPIRSMLAQLDDALAEGAHAFGFTTVTPSFAGHELCSGQPWVQGLSEPYPFHPRAAGELAIAAVVLPHLSVALAAG